MRMASQRQHYKFLGQNPNFPKTGIFLNGTIDPLEPIFGHFKANAFYFSVHTYDFWQI